MRTVPVTLGGVTYHLLLNGAALFDLYDRFGDTGSLTDHLQGAGREAFENTCFFLAKLAEQGELWRRYLGYDHGPLPAAEQLRITLSPLDAAAAKQAVIEAVLAGFAREEGEKPRMVDKGLQALQKKRQRAETERVSGHGGAVSGAGAPGGAAAAGGDGV